MRAPFGNEKNMKSCKSTPFLFDVQYKRFCMILERYQFYWECKREVGIMTAQQLIKKHRNIENILRLRGYWKFSSGPLVHDTKVKKVKDMVFFGHHLKTPTLMIFSKLRFVQKKRTTNGWRSTLTIEKLATQELGSNKVLWQLGWMVGQIIRMGCLKDGKMMTD